MASRATATVAPTIALSDLSACTDVAAVYALFRRLRYPVATPPVAVPLGEDELPAALREGVAARYLIARVGGARPGEPAVDVTLFVLGDAARQSALVRGIAQAWTRRFPGNHLLVFAMPDAARGGDFERITFVSTERLGEGAQLRVKLRKLIVERRHTTRHDLDTLNRIALALAAPNDAAAAYTAQGEAFNVERITGEFYRGYAKLFHAALARIEAENAHVHLPDGRPWQRTFTQRLFGRLMFLYFLQKKGALNQNPNFVSDWYKRAAADGDNFYVDVLAPLFFETLNKPREGARSAQFGRIPYLNGGLFAPDGDLPRDIVVPNEIFDPNSPDGLLYFLDNHNFTVEEDTPLEVEVALDPEMLGKVFENLLEAEERGQSGTFYTPRAVVAFMCREALAAYIERATGIDADRLGWLLDEAETGEPARDEQGRERLTHHTLPRHLREKLEAALLEVRVLDPAVGSGAFPLGMLALLVGTRRALYRVAGVSAAPSSQLVEGWKRDFIRDCLYGVDIKPEAIEIARLRLWLSLVVDADPFDMEPLPNLDYKLMAGDSLIETFDGVEIYPTRPHGEPAQQTLIADSAVPALIHTLHERQAAYFQPDGAGARDALKREIQQTEYDIVHETLRARRENETTNLKGVVQKLANLNVQGKPEPRDLLAERQRIEHSIAVTDAALADLKAGKPLPFFLYRLHFASVFAEKDGFDIVIANPPYVRHEKIAPATLAALKAAYPQVAHGMADLYVYFYARAVELLHAGGTLTFISSNKFFRAGYGQKLRETLKDQTAVRVIIDFGDFPVFDAAAYPCILIADKGAPAADHAYRGLTAGNDIVLDKLAEALAAEGQDSTQAEGVQPPASSSATSALVKRLMALGTPLGEFTGGRMYYGIKTGLMDAFVVGGTTRDRLIAEDGHSADLIKPFLRGRDVDRYTIRHPDMYLLYVGWRCDISRYPAVLAHLTNYRERLEKRPEVGEGRVPWYALSRYAADYVAEFEKPKIVYPDISPHGKFAFDTSQSYAETTLFIIPTDSRFLTAILNSRLLDFVLMHLSPALRGGFLRYKSQYMERLPIVEPAAGDQRRLEELVDALQALGGQGPQAAALEREVDAIVYHTYGLSAEEIAEIERWHAERRAALGAGKRRRQRTDAIDDSKG